MKVSGAKVGRESLETRASLSGAGAFGLRTGAGAKAPGGTGSGLAASSAAVEPLDPAALIGGGLGAAASAGFAVDGPGADFAASGAGTIPGGVGAPCAQVGAGKTRQVETTASRIGRERNITPHSSTRARIMVDVGL